MFWPPQCKEVEVVYYAATLSRLMPKCRSIKSLILRHWLFCQFSSISNAMAFCVQCCGIEATANAVASNAQCLGIQSIFLILYSFWVFFSSFNFNARVITCNIKYHVKVSKMLIMLTKLLSKGTLKYIKFHFYHLTR